VGDINQALIRITTYISFLRGVNMTGHNSIKMADLAALYSNLGLIKPETFIQSGNVIFSSDKELTSDDLAVEIEKAINIRYGYNVPAMIRTVPEMKSIISSNPYLVESDFDPAKMAVIFLHDSPTDSQKQKVADVNYPPDKFKISGNEIYTFCPNGFGRTKIYTNFFENKMKVTGTARNWKTVTTILELALKRV
jgi:uncharacterized protein (DUF1697 family)